MEELRIKDEQLDTLISDMRDMRDGLQKSQRKKQELDMLKDKAKSGRLALQQMDIEIEHQSGSDRRRYRDRLREYTNKLNQLDEDIATAEAGSNTNELLGDHKAEVRDLSTQAGLTEYGEHLDQNSTDSLKRSVVVIHETVDGGRRIADDLERQTEKLSGILEGLDEIDGAMQRSRKFLARIGRRVLTDKYVWLLIGLIVVAIIFIVVWLKSKTSGWA